MSSTPYNRLARGIVRDFIEQPPTVKTMPPHLVNKIIKNKYYGSLHINIYKWRFNFLTLLYDVCFMTGTAGHTQSLQECSIDKYQRLHYNSLIQGCQKSWAQQDGTLIAENVQFYKNNNEHLFKSINSAGIIVSNSPPMGLSGSASVGSMSTMNTSAMRDANNSSPTDDMRTVVFGPPKTASVINTANISSAAIRVGNFLQTRTNLTAAPALSPTRGAGRSNMSLAGSSSMVSRSTSALPPRGKSAIVYDCTNRSLKLNKSLNTLVPIHKSVAHSTTNNNNSQSTGRHVRLTPLGGPSPPPDGNGLSSALSQMSLLSPHDAAQGNSGRRSGGLGGGTNPSGKRNGECVSIFDILNPQ